MINKNLGYLLMFFGLLVAVILYLMSGALKVEAELLGCFEQVECEYVENSLTLTHFAFGVVGFILALGFYLAFFYRGEQEIINAFKSRKENEEKEKQFNIILSVLEDDEAKLMKLIKDQEGIEQSTLVLRSGFSKAKVSAMLKKLEAKKLVKKVNKGKKNSIHSLK